MLFRDFETLTGISLDYGKPFWKAHHSELLFGEDYTWWAWHTVIDREEFLKEYGFDYGDDQCMRYLCMCGVRKVLKICERDRVHRIEQSVYDMIADGLKAIEPPKAEVAHAKQSEVQNIANTLPIQISIVVGGEQKVIANTGEGAE